MISVIIPAYNVEDHIKRCLDSVCAQTFKDIELIVVDDGSSDATPEICDSYAEGDKRVKVIHKENEGVAKARNTALDAASGDMIAFADADDYYEPDMLMKLSEAMAEYGADMACCGYIEEYSDRSCEYGTSLPDEVFDKTGAYEDYLTMGGRMGSGCWNKLIRAEVLSEIRYKPYVMGEDVEMLCRTLDKCDKVVCIGYPGYHYIHRSDSATRAEFGPDNVNMIRVADEMLDFIKRKHPDMTLRMYAYHAAWTSAQIQAMYWSRSTGRFKNEKLFIKDSVRANMAGYENNPYIAARDRILIKSFLYGFFRPVRALYDTMSGLKGMLKKGS